jgi:hypothetical protein
MILDSSRQEQQLRKDMDMQKEGRWEELDQVWKER